MECVNLEYRRRLPPELLTEMHKCLPLANAIYVLVNVSKTFVINNSARMHRTIQRIKTSLKEHIETLVEAEEEDDGEEENDREVLVFHNSVKWRPELDALLLYGSWLTTIRKLYSLSVVGSGMAENFVEKLLMHLANSGSTQMMLQIADIHFDWPEQLPMPTFLKPLFNEKQFRVGNGFVFESVELEAGDGRTIYIHDGELIEYWKIDGEYRLRLFVQNKMNGKEWFKITIVTDKEFIYRLKFKQWKMQSSEDVKKFLQKFDSSFEEKDGNILDAKKSISSNPNLDLFLRRGAKFTQFRHLKINQGSDYLYCCPDDYIDFLINFVSNAKHPEEFLESIDFDLSEECSSSTKNLWEIPEKEIPKGGKFVNFGEKKLHILSARRIWLKVEDSSEAEGPIICEEQKLILTLANIPSNGKYLFDVCLEFGNGFEQIFRIKIQRRKNDKIVEMKCNEQIEKKQGKKRKAGNDDDGEEEQDEDEPTCSNKIMKK